MSRVTLDLTHEVFYLVDIMLDFLYDATYPRPDDDDDEGLDDESTQHDSDQETDNASDLEVHAGVYAIAHKYSIKPLQDLAKQSFDKTITHSWNADLFLQSIFNVLDMMPKADKTLPDLVIPHLVSHLRDLMENTCQRAKLQEISLRYPAFAWEVFARKCDDRTTQAGELAVATTTALFSEGSAGPVAPLNQEAKSYTYSLSSDNSGEHAGVLTPPSSGKDAADRVRNYIREVVTCTCDTSSDRLDHLKCKF